MTEIQDLLRNLDKWNEEAQNKKVWESLKRLSSTKVFTHQQISSAVKTIVSFHKSIQKGGDVDPEWFDQTIKLKKKLKQIQQKMDKEQKSLVKLAKQNSHAQIPVMVLEGKTEKEKKILKYLFKNFHIGFGEEGTNEDIGVFVAKLYSKIFELFGDESNEEKMNKQIDEICMKLSGTTVLCKMQMMKGDKQLEDIALQKEQAYIDDKQKKKQQQTMQEQFEMTQTGYYEKMRKNISKDAKEECRFCHKKAAYCEDMKQIRASDEPMTRFMRCNQCQKNWRD